MAGDWIKMRCDLPDDLEVIAMACELEITEDEVVGKLVRTWSWIQSVSRCGHAPGVTGAWLDRRVGCDGWARAMANVGWLEIREDGLTFPGFEVHMSQGAKSRALAQERQRKSRRNRHEDVTPVSRNARDKTVTREEKRRDTGDASHLLSGHAADAAGPDRRKRDSIRWDPDSGWTGITDADREAWAVAYPAVDVDRAIAQADQWLQANPAKARKKLWRKFVTGWMAREQERGGGSAAMDGVRPARPAFGPQRNDPDEIVRRGMAVFDRRVGA